MLTGDKSSYSDKPKPKVEHIEASFDKPGSAEQRSASARKGWVTRRKPRLRR